MSEPIIKVRRLAYVRVSAPDPARAEAFLEEFEPPRESLRAAVEAGDATAVGRWGHQLKGACRSIAASPLEESLEALEQMGKNGDLTDAKTQLATVETMFPTLLAEIEAIQSGTA